MLESKSGVKDRSRNAHNNFPWYSLVKSLYLTLFVKSYKFKCKKSVIKSDF